MLVRFVSAALVSILLIYSNGQQIHLPDPINTNVNPNCAGLVNTNNWGLHCKNAFNGTCFDPSRQVASFNYPLYTRKITMAAIQNENNWYNIYGIKSVIEERLGYQVNVYDVFDGTLSIAPVYNLLETGSIDFILDSSIADYQMLYNDYVLGRKTVLDLGSIGADNRFGLYVPTQSIRDNKKIAWESYRSYQEDAQGADILTSSRKNEMWDNVLNNPTFGNILLNVPSNPTSYVCTLSTQGCVNSIYTPPQCQNDPQNDCGVILHYKTNAVLGLVQNLVKVYKLNYTVAYVRPSVYQAILKDLINRKKHFIALYIEPNPLSSQICTDTVTGEEFNCLTRITFPTFTPPCLAKTDGTINGTYNCDFQPSTNAKLANPRLAKEAPRVFNLLQKWFFYIDDLARVYRQAPANYNYLTYNYRGAVCNVTTQPDMLRRIDQIIPPPEQCEFNHIEYLISSCNKIASTINVIYNWKLPKACDGGLVLPVEETTTCDYLPIETNTGKLFVILTSIIILSGVVFIFYILKINSRKMILAIINLLPIMSFVYHLSILLFLIINFVNAFEISERVCQARLSLLLISYSFMQGALTAQSIRLNQFYRGVYVDSFYIHKTITFPILSWILINIILLAVSFSKSNLLKNTTYQFGGGAVLNQRYCDLPEAWILYLILGGNAILLCASIHQVVYVYLRIGKDNTGKTQVDDNTKQEDNLYIKPKIQTYTLMYTILGALIIYVAILFSNFYIIYDTNKLIITQNSIILVGMVSIYIRYIYLSIRYHKQFKNDIYLIRNVKKTKLENSKNESSTFVGSLNKDLNMSLDHITLDPRLNYHFEQHCETTFNAESIAFLKEVQYFREQIQLSNLSLDYARREMERIYNKYISKITKPETSEQKVSHVTTIKDIMLAKNQQFTINLQDTMISDIEKSISKVTTLSGAKDVFGPAVNEVELLLKNNCVGSFFNSKHYIEANRDSDWLAPIYRFSIAKINMIIEVLSEHIKNNKGDPRLQNYVQINQVKPFDSPL